MPSKFQRTALVTGAHGFIGRNLVSRLREMNFAVYQWTNGSSCTELQKMISQADIIYHLAGVNRHEDQTQFIKINVDITREICNSLQASNRKIPIIYASSSKATESTPYGKSKLNSEELLRQLSENFGVNVYIYRLKNVFGKWCKPNYNSVVATFCHNLANNLPLTITHPEKSIDLIYIDDVVNSFVGKLTLDENTNCSKLYQYCDIYPVYHITIQELANTLKSLFKSNSGIYLEKVGVGLSKCLNATLLSYLNHNQYFHLLNVKEDVRGKFFEVFQTQESGQISIFTAAPGKLRGDHYHHTKIEKFIVVSGEAKFRFRNIDNDKYWEREVNALIPEVVCSIPGWAHSIENIGNTDLVVLLWSCEIFDPLKPDTYHYKVL